MGHRPGDGSMESENLKLPPAPKVSITHNLLIVFGQFWCDLDSGAHWDTFWGWVARAQRSELATHSIYCIVTSVSNLEQIYS